MDYHRTRAPLAPRAAAAARPAPARSVTPILLIEGDESIAVVTAEILRWDGYPMDRVATPDEALALFTRHGPHAYGFVLSDAFARDGTHAYTWFDHLRTITSAVVAIWSAAPRQYYADHRLHGAAAFLAKPFEVDDLLALLAALVPTAPYARGVGLAGSA